MFLVVFTGLLVVVGSGQGFVFFWTLKATQTAANAAKAAAEALPNVERAYVFFHGIGNISGMLPVKPGDAKSISVDTTFSNLGKTPAIMKGYRCGIVAVGSVPTTECLGGLTKQRLAARAVPSADDPFIETVKVEMRADWIPRPHTGLPPADRVFLVGLLNYDDIFGGHQETCFCWEFDWNGVTFKEALDVPSLNYERALSPGAAKQSS